jgi:hypothetical protein
MTAPSDPLGIHIGAREIYDKLTDVDRKVSDVGGKVDRLSDQHTDLRTDMTEMRADYEARLRSLERGRWPLPSLAALIALASLIVTIINLRGGK